MGRSPTCLATQLKVSGSPMTVLCQSPAWHDPRPSTVLLVRAFARLPVAVLLLAALTGCGQVTTIKVPRSPTEEMPTPEGTTAQVTATAGGGRCALRHQRRPRPRHQPPTSTVMCSALSPVASLCGASVMPR